MSGRQKNVWRPGQYGPDFTLTPENDPEDALAELWVIQYSEEDLSPTGRGSSFTLKPGFSLKRFWAAVGKIEGSDRKRASVLANRKNFYRVETPDGSVQYWWGRTSDAAAKSADFARYRLPS